MQADATPGQVRPLQAAGINYNSRLHFARGYTYGVYMDIMQADLPETGDVTIIAVLRRMVADRETRIATLRARIETLEATLRQSEERAARLETRAAALDRLATGLVWNEGPRAIRAVLPLARLIRRLTRR